MHKFQKRLAKLSGPNKNAMVIGTAFGQLQQILSVYHSIFLIQTDLPMIKAKNLIYKEDFDRLRDVNDVSILFVDLQYVADLEKLQVVWQKNLAKVCIEGNDRIAKELAQPLYNTGWGCTSLQGMFHVWEKIN